MDRPKIVLKDFDVEYLGKKLYKLTLKDPFYVLQTGSAVTKNYKLPFAHRLVRVEVKHTDSSDADNTAAFTWSFAVQKVKGIFEKIIDYASATKTDFIWKFGEGWEFPNGVYKFITNTTNTHRAYLTMVIQLLE